MTEIALRNPRTGGIDGHLAAADPGEVAALAARLRAAASAWRDAGAEARCAALDRFAAALTRHREPLIESLLADTGRWHESVLEVDATIAGIRRWSSEAPALLAEPQPRSANVPFIEVRQVLVPFELVGVISPWNFPLLLSLIDAVPALAAGSAVLVKPSEVTSRYVAALRLVLAEVPELLAVLGVAVGAGTTGEAVIEAVDLVCFTGSVRTGRKVGEHAARRFIPAFLELGGKDPAIVLADADIKRAARAVCWAGFVNAGQSCMSIERVYVEAPVAAAFTEALVAEAARLRLAHPDPKQGEIGPIISAAQIDIVREHLADARTRGARALIGGELVELDGGTWCPPTVLVDVTSEMKVVAEESFATILPVMVVANEDAAVAAANASIYGLSAAVFAGSLERAERVARRLEAGAVSLNDASLTSLVHSGEKQSFKASGLGGSRMGPASIRRFLRPQALLVNPGIDDPWWFPAGSS
jgi:succinate-semialdehyde dehydrogenase / glutarate-semialdehyde dehydrogenase